MTVLKASIEFPQLLFTAVAEEEEKTSSGRVQRSVGECHDLGRAAVLNRARSRSVSCTEARAIARAIATSVFHLRREKAQWAQDRDRTQSEMRLLHHAWWHEAENTLLKTRGKCSISKQWKCRCFKMVTTTNGQTMQYTFLKTHQDA